MPVDAGTIWASIRVRLDKLEQDVNKATKTMNGFAKTINNSGKAVEDLNKLGSKMSLTVTAPLVAAAGAMVKFASDANESMNAANVVFGTASKTITDFSKTAAKEIGLSAAEFNQAAAVIGAGFQNAGYEAGKAAEETIKLSSRASDMASIFNTDVNDSLVALQSALRGEYEPIRRFAVTLNEASVAAEAQRLGLVKTGEELTTYAKTQARLSLIMQQTNRFAGDFKNTSDGLANATKITTAQLKDQAAELGQKLLPYALEIVKAVQNMITKFENLDDATKENILKIGALSAAIGPLTVGIGKAIEAINLMKTALVFLATNPIGWAIAGVAALTYGLVKLGDANNQRMLEEVGDRFGTMADEANLSAQKISDIQEILARSGKGGFSFESAQEQLRMITQDLGVSEDQVVRIAQASEKVSEEYKKTLMNVSNVNTQEKIRLSYMPGTVEFQERVARATAAQAANEKTITDEKDKQSDIDKKYIKNRELVLDILEGEKSEYDKLQEKIDLLQSTPWTTGQLETDRLAAIEALYARQAEILDAEVTAKKEAYDKDFDALLDVENKKRAEWEKTNALQLQLLSIGVTQTLASFNDIGAAIADGTLSWKTFGKAGLNSISAILNALGSEMAVRAAASIASFLYAPALYPGALAAAAKYAGASALAYTSAGLVSGFAGNFEDGGIVAPRNGGQFARVAENNFGEVLYNVGPTGQAHTQQMGEAIGNYLSSRLVVEMDYQAVGRMVMRFLESNKR